MGVYRILSRGGGKSYHRNQQKFVIKEEVNFPALPIKLFVRVVF